MFSANAVPVEKIISSPPTLVLKLEVHTEKTEIFVKNKFLLKY